MRLNPYLEIFHESWNPILPAFFQGPFSRYIAENANTAPKFIEKDVFKVFQMPVQDIKVVILGVEPDYNSSGLAWGQNLPPSQQASITLQNMYRQIYGGYSIAEAWATLEHWHSQGVFLLNVSLIPPTSKEILALWIGFTKKVIQFVSQVNPCVWLLFGEYFKQFIGNIRNPLYFDLYKPEELENIPIHPDFNYVGVYKNPIYPEFIDSTAFADTNTVLKLTKNEIIHW